MTIHSPTPGQPGATPCDDTRRLAWLASELAMDWEIGGVDVAGFAYDRAANSGRETGAADLLYALRFAIDGAIECEAAGAGGGGA